jgi:hypothetical protein
MSSLEVDERDAMDRFPCRDSTEVRVEFDKLVSQALGETEDQRICDALHLLHGLRLKKTENLDSLAKLLRCHPLRTNECTDLIKVCNFSSEP